MVKLTEVEYRERVHGGWLGKLIGAAVGAPIDGRKSAGSEQDAAGYPESLRHAASPAQEGTDFQLVWLRAVESVGPKLDAGDLASAWLRHLAHAHGEYPYARRNMRRAISPPMSGVFDNPFRESLGAMARAELWGLLAPGDPERAAHYAHQDAMLDHAGAGVEGAIWLAAMASAAFAESEPARLIEVGLTFVPEEGRVARAVRDVLRWHAELAHWARTREMLLRAYSSEEVRDSTICAGLIALSLLHGRGDFGRTVATAASCGWSTLCTCGAAGALVGVVLGIEGMPSAWREAVGAEVSAGPSVVGLPGRVESSMLAQRTCEMGRLVIRSQCGGRVQLVEEPSEEVNELPALEASDLLRELAMGSYVTFHRRGPLEIRIDYDGRPTIGYDLTRRLAVGITNVATRSLDLQARVMAPAGFVVTTGSDGMTLPEGGMVSFMVTVSAPREHARIWGANPCTLFVAMEDGSEMTVPITLAGEALWCAAGPYGDFAQAHAPEQPGVLSGDAPLGAEGWRRLSVVEPAVNLLAQLEGEQGTYYLASDLSMPRRRRARLRVGCNDATRVWLNGQEVFFQHEHRPVSPGSADEFEVDLREGRNRLVIKMAQCSPRRFLSVVLKDLDGQLLVEAGNTAPRGQ